MLFFSFVVLFSGHVYASDNATVESFSPEGIVKSVRQVTVRFSEQMVPFGDPRLTSPFAIDCAPKGTGRWVDNKIWVYDFDKDLPGGIQCKFTLKPDIKTLAGRPIEGTREFSFSTGGPAIIEMRPYEGNERIDEKQVFILILNTEADEDSIIKNTYCSITGVNERVGINIIKGEERLDYIKTAYRYSTKKYTNARTVVVSCKRNFPPNTVVKLIWGKGVKSHNGVPNTDDKTLAYKTRAEFTATFSCMREKSGKGCIPVTDMYLNFSEGIKNAVAKRIILKSIDGKIIKNTTATSVKDNDDEDFTSYVNFKGPFPENTKYTIELPPGVKDDSGRPLSNQNKFPLAVSTESYPPLAKFTSRFGIIELKAGAILPLTVRNIEQELKLWLSKTGQDKASTKQQPITTTSDAKDSDKTKSGSINGKIHKVALDDDEEVIKWLNTIASTKRETPILKKSTGVEEIKIPRTEGAKAFEVIGIPLKKPGMYVVELESELLGSSLLAKPAPMYVPTTALVTNMAAHFKWGRESSAVWVTSLDEAEPVKDASVVIRDCNGKVRWSGKTDSDGIARINQELSSHSRLPLCKHKKFNYSELESSLSNIDGGLFVFVKSGEDMTFTHSSWKEGIEPWRFKIENESWQQYGGYGVSFENRGLAAHTIFDRTLIRAGETLHMKHILRGLTTKGFEFLPKSKAPKKMLIRHMGSEQTYELALRWTPSGSAESTWKIPEDAKLGGYEVLIEAEVWGESKDKTTLLSGGFRVEEFRVPMMKGIVQGPAEPLVGVTEAPVDVAVTYLSGGGASELPVKLRSEVQPKSVVVPDYDEFSFSTGGVTEGVVPPSEQDVSQESFDEQETEQDGLAGTEPPSEETKRRARMHSIDLTLDKAGAARTKITGLPVIDTPKDILAELEYRDPNGEVQTVSSRIALYPSKWLIGIKPEGWTVSNESLKCQVAVVNINGAATADRSKPVVGANVVVELFQRKTYTHRRRFTGGFYAYEHMTEFKKVGSLCSGKTNERGILTCEGKSPVSGSVIFQAKTVDNVNKTSVTKQEVWVAGKDDWWFETKNDDRIDFLPEKKRYEPGQTARFQIRMPFSTATALISVEREGIVDVFIKKLSRKSPVVEIPIKDNYAPNVYVSALVVRGRAGDGKPTALFDPNKPAYKIGLAQINVGWQPYTLKVDVSADKEVYKVRQKCTVKVKVRTASGPATVKGESKNIPPKGTEVAIAAVDEGLLELKPNDSWKLLEAMMQHRPYEVETSTAQMMVVGKRHFGKKSIPAGGSGGKSTTRELFDTLLLWKSNVVLDDNGEAIVQVPLNDSLTSFRIVAVATGSTGLFGTGQTSIRTTQDLMLLSGLPPLVRQGDKFRAGFTVRNASDNDMNVEVKLTSKEDKKAQAPINVTIKAGAASTVGWDIIAPAKDKLTYEVLARQTDGEASDKLKSSLKVIPYYRVRTLQATLKQLEGASSMDVERPKDAVSAQGGVKVTLRSTLEGSLVSVTDYMRQYPFSCMEQKVSVAVALKDKARWEDIVDEMPAYLDTAGLLKYFPSMLNGSEVLTSYVLSISHEAGYEIPDTILTSFIGGLKGFVEGKVIRHSALPTADLSIRKMAAVEALSRYGAADNALLASISIEPNLWPTSAVIDWINVLKRVKGIPDADKKLTETLHILRNRMNLQGTTMGFSTESTDNLWWLMTTPDLNAVKTLLTVLQMPQWKEDVPRIVTGAIGRLRKGRWDTTLANAWGVVAMDRFAQTFEKEPVTGQTVSALGGQTKTVEWAEAKGPASSLLKWSDKKETLTVTHNGSGKPWLTVQSLAAIPLKESFSSGYKIKKTVTPIEQKVKGKYTNGDVVKVHLELDAQADMTWVVVNDPIPGGATILGSGLGRDSSLLAKDTGGKGWVWEAFRELSFEGLRVYYEYVPKGKWSIDYVIRLNNEGVFQLPETRVEALYAPEMFGEIPNTNWEVQH
ncbi:MAG: alpha-2-macroglobulin [Nitrospirae bacterium]|nr:alpha-2-macroglobulin [Nitrospirota bacterium]